MPRNPNPVEIKYYENSLTPTSVAGTGSLALVSSIDGGFGESERLGNKIYMRHLFARTSFTINAAATQTFVRLIWILTARLGNNTPVIGQIFQSTTATDSYLSPLNHDNSDAFTILADIMVQLSINGPMCVVRKTFRRINQNAKYISTTGSSGFDQGNIWLVAMSNEATNTPTIRSYNRIGYTDA